MMALRIRRALAAAPRRGISSGGVVCSAEVRAALDRRGPVVALESTIITHGMPYPRNLEVARAVEARVRAGGAVPATVAVLDGKLRVGLSDAELERVAVAGDRGAAVKCSRRDLADVASRSANDGALVGATTVAGTAVAAHLAGVEVFATGGIGGVHRGAEATFDASAGAGKEYEPPKLGISHPFPAQVSADLVELGRTPILVVCAGVKSILDVPKTLEVLETQGVAVIGYGTDDLAAFFAARSSDNNKINRAPLRYDDAAGVAGWLAKNAELGLASGAVLAVRTSAHGRRRSAARSPRLEARGRLRQDATPFLLAKLEEVTGGASLEANVALVLNNARVAAEIAVARAGGGPARRPPTPCAGTSAPGAASTTFGGVGRNIAVAALRRRNRRFAAAAEPRSLAALAADGVDASFAAATAASSTYVAVHDGAGDLVGAVFAEGGRQRRRRRRRGGVAARASSSPTPTATPRPTPPSSTP
ncbi:hypothetical protein JL722_2631 [Aureococcus anophagefferens]|nr:hypothetical protein JL722_2631 [Aureococcus anophagefferens]